MMTTWAKDHPHPSTRTLLPVCCLVIPGKSADMIDMPACQPHFGLLSSSIHCGPLLLNINAIWVTALCALTATRRGAGSCMNASYVKNPCAYTLALKGTIPSCTSRCHAQGRTCTRVRLAASMMTLILLCQVPPGQHHRHPSLQPRHQRQRPGDLPVV